jgi:transposase-like protein
MERESREVWAKRVERLADSGLTLKEFAAEIGVNANTLAGWRWRIQNEAKRAAAGARPSSPAFLEIVAAPREEAGSEHIETPARERGEPFELVLRGGHRVRIPLHFDPGALRRLVHALEAA